MRVTSNFIFSIVLTATVSFVFPVALIVILLGTSSLIGLLPVLAVLAHSTRQAVLEFLMVFGTGKPLVGTIILGLTSTTVGIIFDIFNFYRYQSLRD